MRCSTTIGCLLLLLLGCRESGTDAVHANFAKAGGVAPGTDAAATDADTADAAQNQDAARKVVRTGEMLLHVAELDAARTSVVAATRAAGGYVAEDRLDDRGRDVRRVLRVRVPANRFDELVATASASARPRTTK